MRKLFETTIAISGTEIALIVVALVRNKYLAVSIGPKGFGIYGLLSSFFALATVFSATWLATGATKYISEYNKKDDVMAVQRVYAFSVGLTTSISLVMAIIFIAAQEPLRKIFLSEEVLSFYFMLFAAAFVCDSLKSVYVSLLQGLMQVRSVVFTRIVTSLVEVVFVIVFVYLFDLAGFFVSLFISSLFAALILYKQLKKFNRKFSLRDFRFRFDNVSNKLLIFGGVNFLLGFTNLGALFIQRKIILDTFDMVTLGILQAVLSIKSYSDILGRGSSFHFFPRMSEELNTTVRIKEINDYIFFSLITFIPIAISIILFGEYIVSILYSSKFLQVVPVLSWFIIAEYVHNIERSVGQTIVGLAALKIHSFVSIMGYCFWVFIPLFFASKYGLKSIAFAYILSSFSSLIIGGFYLSKRINLRISFRNILLILVGIIIIIAISTMTISLFAKPFILFVALGFLVFLFLVFLNKEEKLKISLYFNELICQRIRNKKCD